MAGMQPRHVVALGRRTPAFLDDLVERHRRGVDDTRAGRAMIEECLRHQRAGVEAHGAARDQVAATHGDQIGGARPGADEMHRHRPSPVAMAQVARSVATRVPSRRPLWPATTSADASAIDGRPLALSASLEDVRTWPATRSTSATGQATSLTDNRRATSGKPGSVAFSDSVAIA